MEKLHHRGLLAYRMKANTFVGVFTVAKKQDQLRLIFDCRAANAVHRTTTSADLATPSAITNVDCSDHMLKQEQRKLDEAADLTSAR